MPGLFNSADLTNKYSTDADDRPSNEAKVKMVAMASIFTTI